MDTMVPLPNHTKVKGKPLKELTEDRLETIVERTRKGGAEIIKFLEKGSVFAPKASEFKWQSRT